MEQKEKSFERVFCLTPARAGYVVKLNGKELRRPTLLFRHAGASDVLHNDFGLGGCITEKK
jgi:hypothetical protein